MRSHISNTGASNSNSASTGFAAPVELRRHQRGHAFYEGLDSVPAPDFESNVPFLDRTIHAHYFVGGADWWVAELDRENWIAYGWVNLGVGPEWGPFELTELEDLTVTVQFEPFGPMEFVAERDCNWAKKPARNALSTRGLLQAL